MVSLRTGTATLSIRARNKCTRKLAYTDDLPPPTYRRQGEREKYSDLDTVLLHAITAQTKPVMNGSFFRPSADPAYNNGGGGGLILLYCYTATALCPLDTISQMYLPIALKTVNNKYEINCSQISDTISQKHFFKHSFFTHLFPIYRRHFFYEYKKDNYYYLEISIAF